VPYSISLECDVVNTAAFPAYQFYTSPLIGSGQFDIYQKDRTTNEEEKENDGKSIRIEKKP